MVHPALQQRAEPSSPGVGPRPPVAEPTPPAAEAESARTFPRPLISTGPRAVAQHDTTNRPEEVPSALYEFACPDLANAPARFVRSSTYLLLDNAGAFSRSGVPLALTFTPFAEQGAGDCEVPLATRAPGVVLRCDRCRVFANPAFAFRDGWRRYTCNMCGLEGAVETGAINGMDFSAERYPETSFAVSTVPMSADSKFAAVSGNDLLLCFDFSLESLENGSFIHALASVRASLSAVSAETRIGFALWDSTVTFFRFGSEGEPPFLCRSLDSANPVAAAAPADVLFNAHTQSAELLRAIEFLEQLGAARLREQAAELRNTPHCLEQVAGVAAEFFEGRAGHVLVFASAHRPRVGEPARYAPDEKAPFRARAPSLVALAERLSTRCVSLDLFLTPPGNIELASISELSLGSAGKVNYYPAFDLSADAERFFYDLHRALTVPRVYDVAVRLRHSSGLHILEYQTPRGPIASLDFRLPSLTADSVIVAQLKLSENLRDIRVAHFQLAIAFTTCAGERRLRTINLALRVTADPSLFFGQLDCEALAVGWLRSQAWRVRQNPPGDALKETMAAAEKLFRYYRCEVGGRYQAREFALPKRLGHLPVYLGSFLAQPFFSSRAGPTPDAQFAALLSLLQTTPGAMLCVLYPKIFDLNRLLESGDVGDSLPASAAALRPGGAYLVDNGLCLFLCLGGASPALRDELLGDDGLLQSNDDLSFNRAVHSLIEQRRAAKPGIVQAVCVLGGDNAVRQFCVESNPTPFSADQWSFLTYLHERVRDQ